jgi:hypothetical protein
MAYVTNAQRGSEPDLWTYWKFASTLSTVANQGQFLDSFAKHLVTAIRVYMNALPASLQRAHKPVETRIVTNASGRPLPTAGRMCKPHETILHDIRSESKPPPHLTRRTRKPPHHNTHQILPLGNVPPSIFPFVTQYRHYTPHLHHGSTREEGTSASETSGIAVKLPV